MNRVFGISGVPRARIFPVMALGEAGEPVPVYLVLGGGGDDAVSNGAQGGGAVAVLEHSAFPDDRTGAEFADLGAVDPDAEQPVEQQVDVVAGLALLGEQAAGTPGKPGGKGRVMPSIGDTSATKNAPDTKAVKNGPGAISDAVAVFEADATKLPAEPVPDAYVAVAYSLGWAVGDALICAKYQIFGHLVKVPELDDPASQWKLLVRQILSRCSHINNHLKSVLGDQQEDAAVGCLEGGKKPPRRIQIESADA